MCWFDITFSKSKVHFSHYIPQFSQNVLWKLWNSTAKLLSQNFRQINFLLKWFDEKNCAAVLNAQFSHFSCKNFVKATFLLKKSIISCQVDSKSNFDSSRVEMWRLDRLESSRKIPTDSEHYSQESSMSLPFTMFLAWKSKKITWNQSQII